MTRLDKLWRFVKGPGAPPRLNSRGVRARVNAALDAGHEERKIYMKQKMCTALMTAAILLAITGTALAAVVHLDALTAHFKGDAAPGQAYLDSEARLASDENYTFTVESSVADERCVYLVVTVAARSDEAKEFLFSDHFISIDTFSVGTPAESKTHELQISGLSSHELESDVENCRRFALKASTNCAVDTLYVRCGYMEQDKRVEVPVAPAPSVTVKIGDSGKGTLELYPASSVSSDRITVKEVTLSPFTCQVKMKRSTVDVYPRIFLRMKDGAIRTQAQLMTHVMGDLESSQDDFKEVQDLDNISSVIVFDREYPLDGSAPTPVEHDPALDPIMLKPMERLSEDHAFSLSAQELTEKLGGTYQQDPATGKAVCVYRGVTIVLQPGSATALVNGSEVFLPDAPAMQDGVLAAPHGVFADAWGLDCTGLREYTENSDGTRTVNWLDWYIVP